VRVSSNKDVAVCTFSSPKNSAVVVGCREYIFLTKDFFKPFINVPIAVLVSL
jgi:hypothetical protein